MSAEYSVEEVREISNRVRHAPAVCGITKSHVSISTPTGARIVKMLTAYAERIKADESAVPVLHIRCEVQTESNIAGSTYLKVVRVEQEDDGSFTAVTDHWPTPPAQAAQVPDTKVVPYGSSSGEKDYAYGYEKGYADGWNACRAAMLAAPTAEPVAQGQGDPCIECGAEHGKACSPDCVCNPAASPAGVPDGLQQVFAIPERCDWADESDHGRFGDAQKFLAGFGLVIAAPSAPEGGEVGL